MQSLDYSYQLNCEVRNVYIRPDLAGTNLAVNTFRFLYDEATIFPKIIPLPKYFRGAGSRFVCRP